MRQLVSRNIQGQLILLGTGTSVGVPVIGCGCPVCRGGDPRNQRTRSSAVWGLPQGNLLIDTPPDLRQQLIREDLGLIHAVLFTHEHADHIFGLDDLRLFQFYLGHPVPLYCEPSVEERIRKAYDYAFSQTEPTHPGAAPSLQLHRLDESPLELLGARIIPIRLEHGPRFSVLGFRIGNIAYCTDTNHIPETSWPLLEGLDVLILDALRPRPHPTHFSLSEAVEAAQRIAAGRTYFTHMSCELDYHSVNARLPPGMELAYDGLQIPLS